MNLPDTIEPSNFMRYKEQYMDGVIRGLCRVCGGIAFLDKDGIIYHAGGTAKCGGGNDHRETNKGRYEDGSES
jgi:hypothetical protein